jgi:predicted porin
MENTLATTNGNFTSGRINPGQTDNITATVINPFLKFKGLELFGNFETSKGKAANETADRTWNQFGADLVYRFGMNENFYVAGRYNQVKGKLAGSGLDVTLDRTQIGGGWFISKNILAKVEYVVQNYDGFAANDIRNGGKFNGLMIEGVIGF